MDVDTADEAVEETTAAAMDKQHNAGVVPASELRHLTILRPLVRRQNTWFAVAMTSFLLLAAGFVVVRFVVPAREMQMIEKVDIDHEQAEEHITSSTTAKPLNATAVGQAFRHWNKQRGPGGAKVPGHSHQSDIEDYLRQHGKRPEITDFAKDPKNHTGGGHFPHGKHVPRGHPTQQNKDGGSGGGGPNGGHKATHSHITNSKTRAWLDATVTVQDGIKYEIVERLEHDPKAFTEGLAYRDGMMWESTGLNGKSMLSTLDPDTGKTLKTRALPSKYFGEGLTYANGKLFQLTWKSNTGFTYNAFDLDEEPEMFEFHTTREEGWGMTYNAAENELIVSDGSEYLHFWSARNLKPLRKVAVIRQNGKTARDINELEWWRGRVLANVWFEDVVLVINPETGAVEKEYDFSQLWPKNERRAARADVLNGISVSEQEDVLYFTGKNWDRMFKIRLKY